MVQYGNAHGREGPVAFVGVGSNIDPEDNVRAGLEALARRASIVAVSTFYRTRPVGATGSADFYNGVVELRLPGGRPAVLGVLTQVEDLLARRRTADANAPRTIDLDLLLILGDDGRPGKGEKVHPDVEERAFVVLPLLELAGDLTLPGSGRRLSDVARGFEDPPGTPLPEFTNALKVGLRRV